MKIDAVITWVDGNDPVHREKRKRYAAPGMLKANDVAGDTRFVEVGEIAWCVASLNRFAPWINKIYIVTDSQDPGIEPFLQKNFPEGHIPVELVDHKVIYRGYEEYLPTFNASAIESMTWRIPGLSDHFIEFNDDLVLCAPVSSDDFFTPDGRSVCYSEYANIPWTRFTRLFKSTADGHRKVTLKGVQANAACMAGSRWRFLRINHTPKALRRDWYQAYFESHPEDLVRNLKCRFRNPDMYVPEVLQYTHLNKEGRCEIRPLRGNLLYLQPNGKKGYVERKLNALRHGRYLFGCFNSIDLADSSDLALVRQWVCETFDVVL